MKFDVLIQCVKDHVDEYRNVNLSQHMSVPLQGQSNVWVPPPEGGFKLNVDGAVDTRKGKRNVGVAVRAIPSPNLVSVLATEIYALKVGLEFAIDASWLPFIVESDLQNAV